MLNTLENIKEHKHDFVTLLLKEAAPYTYRDTRYNDRFGIVAVCDLDGIQIDVVDKFRKMLRATDKVVCINENVFCVILDSVGSADYIKVAENINYNLLKFNVQEAYYISAVNSEDYNKDYSKMVYDLFLRLEDALVNNLKNIVVYQDFVI